MHGNGPEYIRGWVKTFSRHDGPILVEARHYTRRRPPRGREIVQQTARGLRPGSLVEETEFEWSIIVGHHPVGTIRALHNGRFSLVQIGRPYRVVQSIEEAVQVLV